MMWPQGKESDQPAWSHHQDATQNWVRSNKSVEAMKWIPRQGVPQLSNLVPLSPTDRDEATTRELRRQLGLKNWQEADRILQRAQRNVGDPSGLLRDAPIQPAVPTLSSGMRAEIERGDAKCFHIFLYDSCAEDGDVVDLLINGVRFATVPITNEGTTLSVPIAIGSPASLTIRGVFDGRGGITVACRTSLGQGFVRVLAPGEEQDLAVIGS
jgi:hypothetical protein